MAFTAERFEGHEDEEGQGWSLQRSGRFSHRQSYLETLARAHGLHVEYYEQIVPRMELGKEIQGHLFVLRKPHL